MSSPPTHVRQTIAAHVKYVANAALVSDVNPSNVIDNVTGVRQIQSITLTNTTGINVGDWLCFGIGAPQSDAWMRCEAVKVLSKTGNSITAVISQFHPAGELVRGCTQLTFNGGANIGQQRYLVNRSNPYSVGQIKHSSSNVMVGSGTNWSVGMIGGTVNNIGLIALTADDTTPNFYPSFTPSDPAKAWYPIKQVNSPTELVLHRQQQANFSAYEGKGKNFGTYQLCPAARVLRPADPLDQYYSVVLLDYNEFDWPVGTVLDCPISTSLDISGGTFRMYHYTPGCMYRTVFQVQNGGTEDFEAAFACSSMGSGGGFKHGGDFLGTTAGIAVGAEPGSGGDAILIKAYSPSNSTPSEGTIRWGNSGALMGFNWKNMGYRLIAAKKLSSGIEIFGFHFLRGLRFRYGLVGPSASKGRLGTPPVFNAAIAS